MTVTTQSESKSHRFLPGGKIPLKTVLLLMLSFATLIFFGVFTPAPRASLHTINAKTESIVLVAPYAHMGDGRIVTLKTIYSGDPKENQDVFKNWRALRDAMSQSGYSSNATFFWRQSASAATNSCEVTINVTGGLSSASFDTVQCGSTENRLAGSEVPHVEGHSNVRDIMLSLESHLQTSKN